MVNKPTGLSKDCADLAMKVVNEETDGNLSSLVDVMLR